MEEMNRTHKEPVWGWVAAVGEIINRAGRNRVRADLRALRRPRQPARVVTPWSPRSETGWSA